MFTDNWSLEYNGDKVKNGQLKAKDVAKYIAAIDDFMNVISIHAYGKETNINIDVSGFRGNSFDIDFALQVVNIGAGAIFSTASPQDLISLATDCIKACLHLKGQPPIETTKNTVNNTIDIKNNYGQSQIFHIETLNVIADTTGAKSLETFIREPLLQGIESVTVKSTQHNISACVAANEADYYKPINLNMPLFKNSIKTGLVIESPSFKDGNKWRFSDGQSSFYAEITDPVFLKAVDSGEERFGKNDILTVEMDIIQYKSISGLKIEKVVTKVLEHQLAQHQHQMF